jgi:hypothetical protein
MKIMETIKPSSPMSVRIDHIEPSDISAFSPLLQEGVGVLITSGAVLTKILGRDMGLDSAYIDARIKTVFLNGHPVDDYASAVVNDGDALALSAAMPGLVGATFRSGGILSPFRSGISFRNASAPDSRKAAWITVKLFNLLVKEIGPGLLEKGVRVPATSLGPLLEALSAGKNKNRYSVCVDDQAVDPDNSARFLQNLSPRPSDIRLTVNFTHAAPNP